MINSPAFVQKFISLMAIHFFPSLYSSRNFTKARYSFADQQGAFDTVTVEISGQFDSLVLECEKRLFLSTVGSVTLNGVPNSVLLLALVCLFGVLEFEAIL